MGKHEKIVKGGSVRGAIQQLKREHHNERMKHHHVERYLKQHKPEVWQRVVNCRSIPRIVPHNFNGTYRVRLLGCHTYPWCFACSREAKYRRANQALARFSRCTPEGKPFRLAHIVETAAVYEDGGGWGMAAFRNIGKFREVMRRTLSDAYGKQFGAYVSFQAFGERAFGKWHPHLDLTLNGFQPGSEGVELTRTYDTTGSGYRRWEQRFKEHAGAVFLLHTDEIATNFKLQHFRTGAANYYRALLYQVRELVDVRKMEFNKDKQLVYWHSYKNNDRQRMTVERFHEGLAEYQRNVGAWGDYQAKQLHVGIGHLADKSLPRTQQIVGGGERPHRKTCRCIRCDSWGDPIYPDEDGAYEFDPWKENAGVEQAPVAAFDLDGEIGTFYMQHERLRYVQNIVRTLAKQNPRGWAGEADVIREAELIGLQPIETAAALATLQRNYSLYAKGGRGTVAPLNP